MRFFFDGASSGQPTYRLSLYSIVRFLNVTCFEFQVQSKASSVSSGTRASAIINANAQQTNQQQQQQQHQPHSRSSSSHEQEKSSRSRRRSVSPVGLENGQEVESYYHQQQHQQQNGNYHHQSMTSVAESHQRNSINHQDVVMNHDSPYSKDMPDMEENGGGGMIHQVNGNSSKYSLLQFAAQHFRNE